MNWVLLLPLQPAGLCSARPMHWWMLTEKHTVLGKALNAAVVVSVKPWCRQRAPSQQAHTERFHCSRLSFAANVFWNSTAEDYQWSHHQGGTNTTKTGHFSPKFSFLVCIITKCAYFNQVEFHFPFHLLCDIAWKQMRLQNTHTTITHLLTEKREDGNHWNNVHSYFYISVFIHPFARTFFYTSVPRECHAANYGC